MTDGEAAGNGVRKRELRLPESDAKSKTLHSSGTSQYSSLFSRWRNPILGTLLVIAGLATALLTLLARRLGEFDLARIGAIASLIFVFLILVLIVPPLTKKAFAEFSGFGFGLEVTTGGMVFVIILVIVAFAAWNTGNNLLFMIFSLLTATLFVSWAAARASLSDLTVSARFPDHIFAGDPNDVIVTLHNTKRLLPSFSILVESRASSSPDKTMRKARSRHRNRALAYFIYVPHRAAAEQRVEQIFSRRGHVLVNGFELSTKFPFGFFRHRRRLRARDVDIVVYPKPELLTDELHLLPLYGGRLASMRRGAGHDLFSLRDYQPFDDLRHINWKATARTGRLTMREFTAEDERRITVSLDTIWPSDIDRENFRIRFERGVVQAASLVKHFIEERALVRLMLGADCGDFGAGLSHFYECLRRLALVEPVYGEGETDHWLRILKTVDPARQESEANYFVFLTTAARGSIPANIWRRAFVIYL
jgi:uncharacterized protein (DUF58 family)